jgi:chromosome segregation ATPase
VERYNEEMKNEIAVTRRATYKAEENVASLEDQKKGQDLYIDSLNEQVKQLGEKISTHEAEIGDQRNETEEANKMLAETGHEMELINFEKKQLMQQWKTSLIQLTKRDEALAAAQKTLKEAQMELRDMDTEIDGAKREILAAQGENETLVAVRDRLQKEDGTLEEQIAKMRAERDALADQYNLLQRSMGQTDEEERKVDSLAAQLKQQVDQIAQNIQVVTRERQKLEEGIAANKNAQTTVSKAVRNLNKATTTVVAQSHEKEMDAAHLENELSRIRVDTLNTDAHNMQLRDTLSKLVSELKEKDRLIEKYQLEIRQRNDEIEKKMYRVDRLNRKYEKLMEGAEDVEHMGPLEATIKNLKKEEELVEEESAGLQREWLTDQTQLVNTIQATETALEKNSELRARVSILSEKRLRLLKDITLHEAEVKALQHAIRNMHSDMSRLNELIGRNTKLQAELANANAVMEMEFKAELKELEDESMVAEGKIHEVKEAKQVLLEEIVETERQLLLWEKKIQLERETQAALDPEVGMAEIKAMEKEIHRMRLRLETLKREQERMIVEMERSIYKRESISLRFKGKAKPTGVDYTQATLRKKVAALRRSIQQTARDAAKYSGAIQQRQKQIAELTSSLEGSTTQYGQLEETANQLQGEINELLYEKQRKAELLNKREKMVARYHELERKPQAPLQSLEVEQRFLESQNELSAVRQVIGTLRSKFDYLDEPLERVLRLTDDE